MKFVLENGYNNTGLNEVLAASGVPKGSFYYYFSSKENFGLELIEQFEQANKAMLKEYLQDQTFDPLSRLRRYFQSNIDFLVGLECRQGCLIGNLGQEMADQSETFRLRVQQVLKEWAASLAACLKEAQEVGQLAPHFETSQLGSFLLANWQGAILLMKVTKNSVPLDTFMFNTFKILLKSNI